MEAHVATKTAPLNAVITSLREENSSLKEQMKTLSEKVNVVEEQNKTLLDQLEAQKVELQEAASKKRSTESVESKVMQHVSNLQDEAKLLMVQTIVTSANRAVASYSKKVKSYAYKKNTGAFDALFNGSEPAAASDVKASITTDDDSE